MPDRFKRILLGTFLYPWGYIETMTDTNRDSILRRLARAEGQIAGLRRMISEDRYCIDILTQLSAARAALDNAGLELLSQHMVHCVRQTPEAHPHAKEMSEADLIEEFKTAMERFIA